MKESEKQNQIVSIRKLMWTLQLPVASIEALEAKLIKADDTAVDLAYSVLFEVFTALVDVDDLHQKKFLANR